MRGVNNSMHKFGLVRFVTVHILLRCPYKGHVIPLRFYKCLLSQDGEEELRMGAWGRGRDCKGVGIFRLLVTCRLFCGTRDLGLIGFSNRKMGHRGFK